jgi:ADP-ribose pyrophosphatase
MSDKKERERAIYAGRVVTLRLKYLDQPDGTRHLREIVEHRPGAAVVAVDAAEQIILVRQARPAVGADVLELPAGIVDPGETPLACASRELQEETGYTAGRVEPLVSFFTSPGFCTELIHVFVATDLRGGHAAHDDEELIEVEKLSLEAAIDRVLNGAISDAKTVAGLLAYYRMSSARSTIGR